MKTLLCNETKGFLRVLVVLAVVLALLPPVPVYAADNTISITVEQIYSAPAGTSGDTFTYILKPLLPDNPMPLGSTPAGFTFTVTGSSSKIVGPITYSEQGLYLYELYQVTGQGDRGYIYDRRVFTVEVHVDEHLNAYVVIRNGSGDKELSIVFVNEYRPGGENPEPPDVPEPPDPIVTTDPPTDPPPPVEPPDGGNEVDVPDTNVPGSEFPGEGPKTGDDSNMLFDVMLFSFGSLLFIGATLFLIISKKRGKVGG